MNKSLDWRQHVNVLGDLELPNYLFRVNSDLMKQALDLGTLLSDDPAKLRAYKEQIKKIFKKRWLEVAEALEFLELIVPCGCNHGEYCSICSGSRYQINQSINPDIMREIGSVFSFNDPGIIDKLRKGLKKAIQEVNALSTVQ